MTPVVSVQMVQPVRDVEDLSIRIVHPTPKSQVARTDSVVVEGIAAVPPVVLIRQCAVPGEPPGPWYPSGKHTRLDLRRNVFDVRFGSGDTLDETKFELCVADTAQPNERAELLAQPFWRDLPPAVRTGPVRRVILDTDRGKSFDLDRYRAAEGDSSAIRLRFQHAGPMVGTMRQTAERRMPVIGTVQRPGRVVVLTRGQADPNHWYIQSPVQQSGGRFACTVYLGRAEIAKPTGFEIVAVLCSEAFARGLDVDQPLRQLPSDGSVSQILTVVRSPSRG